MLRTPLPLALLLAALLLLPHSNLAGADEPAGEPVAEEVPAENPAAAEAPQPEPAGDEPADAEPSDEKVSFRRDVAPVLVTRCLGCHGQDDPQGEYQLHNFASLMKEGYSSSPVVTPGDPEESELYLLLIEDEDYRMPKDADPVPDDDIERIRRWIEQGAEYDGPDPEAALASILPSTEHPAAPETYRVPVPITALAFAAGGNELAAAGYHEITIWNAAEGTLVRRIGNVAERTYGLAYSPDGSLLAAASGNPAQLGEVRLFDAATGSLVRVLGSMSDVALDVAFSPDGTRLAACAANRSVRIYDVASGTEEVLIEDHADWVIAVAWSPDGQKLASASRDKTSKVFEAASGDSLTTFPGHNEAVYSVAFSADGSQVLTGGGNKVIHIWNPDDGKKAADIGGFGHDVYEIIVHGDQVFSCSADKRARQHGGEKREHVRDYDGHSDWVYAMTLDATSGRLATGSYDGEVRVWNIEDGALVKQFIAAPGFTETPSQQAAAP